MDEQQRSLFHDSTSFVLMIGSYLQGISHETSFRHGSILQILLSIMVQHATPNTTGHQRGLSEAADSVSGRRMAHSCGSVEIVCFSCRSPSPSYSSLPLFSAGSGKSILWYGGLTTISLNRSLSFEQFCDYRGHQTYAAIQISTCRVLLL
jgi:hypothetical protein